MTQTMICLITGVADDYELRIDDGAFERMPVVDDLEITNTAGTSLIGGSNTI